MANGPEFFQTIMGRTFYEGTMPRLVKQLEKLNENLEKANADAVVTNFEGTMLDDALDHFQKTEEREFFHRALLDRLPTEALEADLAERRGAHPPERAVHLQEVPFVFDNNLDPKELSNTHETLNGLEFGTEASAAFRRAQSTLEELRLKMESDNAKKWVVLCKRTEDPKLGWLERTLDGHGIPNRRNGFSFHGPILEVREDFEARAQRILSLVDHMDDDNSIFLAYSL